MTLLSDTNHEEQKPGLEIEGNVEAFPIVKINPEGASHVEDRVAREMPVTIILNDNELVTLLCSPAHLKYMAVGFLASEGLIQTGEEIKRVTVDEERGVVRVATTSTGEVDPNLIFKRVISSGCGRGASFYSTADSSTIKVESDMRISSSDIFALVNRFQHGSQLYPVTHGNHSAALCAHNDILVFEEDIGRHNAIDKIFGKCLLENIPTEERIVITSGRITSEVLHKVAKRNIPVLISISAPTNLGVHIAETLGITLVASVRGKKMNVYTRPERIITG
jgi:FdhD protein